VTLLVLAGCSAGVGGPPTAADTATDGAPTTDVATTPTLSGTPLPPGVRADGSVNETALARAHAEALNGTAYRWHARSATDGVTSTNVTVHAGPNGTLVVDDGPVEYRWSTGAVGGTYRPSASESPAYTFAETDVTERSAGSGTGLVSFGLSVRITTGEYRAVGTVDRDGESLIELRATEPGGRYGAALAAYEGTLLVGPDGVVRSASGRVARADEGNRTTTFEHRVDPSVDAPTPPAWYDRLPRGRLTLTDDGAAATLTLTGGEALPAGTTLELSARGERHRLALDESLAPGETVSLAVVQRGGERRAVLARTPPTDGLALEGSLVTLRVETDGVVATYEAGSLVPGE
jgi:hypothetical protein